MRKYVAIFILSFAVFAFFLTPNVNTGDAGELITSSYYMGVAHPSGYPVYLQICKAASFLPFGNIAFRVGLVSAFFSSLSLTIIFWLIFRITENRYAALFGVALLLVSYSYFTQSVVAKFYPLNLFLVLSIYCLWVYIFWDGYNARLIYCTSFILGLITGNHHTGLLMSIPFMLVMFFFRKEVHLRTLLVSFFLFLLGFLINAYMLIRGSDASFFNACAVRNSYDFWSTFLRLPYTKGGSIATVGETINNLSSYWYALINVVKILTKNFSLFSAPLFFLGVMCFFRKNRALASVTLLTLFLYGPFLAKMSFAGEAETGEMYYIIAHQYFLPVFAFYVLFLGFGFYQIVLWLKAGRFGVLYRALPVILSFFPLVFLVSRATDSNYRTNHVPYQLAKDMHSILPVDSVFMAYGDNEAYQGWYVKLIGRYRDDNCMVSIPQPQDTVWSFEACNPKIYGNMYPAVFRRSINEKAPLMVNMRLYGTAMITKDFAFNKHMHSRPFALQNMYLPNKRLLKNIEEMTPFIDGFLREKSIVADKLVNPEVCISHFTDDNFTGSLCSRYFFHLIEMAKLYSGEENGFTGKKVDIIMQSAVSIFSSLSDYHDTFKIPITEKNWKYIDLFSRINKHNEWEIFYVRKK